VQGKADGVALFVRCILTGMTYLRNISLSVDESDPGCFYWVLMESLEDSTIFQELSAAPESAPTYEAALDAGVVALKALSENLTVGPQAPGENENNSPVGKNTRQP
jgi:hypothetical protein